MGLLLAKTGLQRDPNHETNAVPSATALSGESQYQKSPTVPSRAVHITTPTGTTPGMRLVRTPTA